MRKDISSQPKSVSSETVRDSFVSRLLNNFLHWWDEGNANRLVLVPAIVMAILISTLLSNSKPTVTHIQDIAGLKIISQDSQIPGIGFFNNANIKHLDYAGVQAEMTGSQELLLNWPVIVDAAAYNIKLQRFIDGKSETVAQFETSSNSVKISLEDPYYNVRYEWTLSGEKTDDTAFFSRGGFVIDD